MGSSEEVVSVSFGVMSDKDILAASACEINKPTFSGEPGSVYDPRLGSIQNNVECETCSGSIWTCPGHFGHINLCIPIILYHKQTTLLLKCFCHSCCRLLATEEELKLNSISGFVATANFLAGLKSCTRCKTPAPDIKVSLSDCVITATHKHKLQKATRELTPEIIKTIFDSIPKSDVVLLGLNPKMVKPSNFVLTKFQVVPTCCRPKMHAGDNTSDDDLSLLLIDIIKNNLFILSNPWEKCKTEKERAAFEKAVSVIRTKTLAYCDNTRCRAIHTTTHKPMTGIKERINCKTGLVRQNLTGKRCDRTARTVIGPDPTLRLDEVGVPEEIANTLTIPEIVNTFNISTLTALVNSGKASTIIKKNGIKLNVHYARICGGTNLEHSDIIIRGSEMIPVTSLKMKLENGDFVKKSSGTTEPVQFPQQRTIVLEIGDKVERYLKNGDPIYMNRQPTLHRNSMLGMKVVVKPGRTIRFNLSITKGLNADFDGDEANLFCCETFESKAELIHLVNVKEHMLSAQINKPEQVFVQDSLLAAYLMTKTPRPISRHHFFNCLMKIDPVVSIENRNRQLFAADLFQHLFPPDFNVTYPPPSNLKISRGKIISGYFDKASLGSSKNAIVRLLRMEYDKHVASKFIDNLQFVTNAWLEQNPFSIGIADCLIDEQSKLTIEHLVEKYFIEASVIGKSIYDSKIKEFRVNMTLNKAKDLGLKIAKEAFSPTNNFLDTVLSGSKGDFFNIAQITGLLGQQNLSNQRPVATLTNGKRTLIHYPFVTRKNQQFESRGFVSSSFIKGLTPKEMWFHATTGREGMINTAMKTARSGYLQRSCVKLNEDLKVEYDGTVRDAGGAIFQFMYGGHGFDPSLVTIKDKVVVPIDIERLAEKLNGSKRGKSISKSQIDEIVKACEWKCQIPREIFDNVWGRHEKKLRAHLSTVCVVPNQFEEFKRIIAEKFHTARACPGECVGIISAQSIGEIQTQSNLNTFHTAGKLQSSGIERFEEILNMHKVTKCPFMHIYFNQKFDSAQTLRETIGSTIVGLTLKDLMVTLKPEIFEKCLRFRLKKSCMFKNSVCPQHICEAIEAEFEDLKCVCESSSVSILIDEMNREEKTLLIKQLESVRVCGIEGLTAAHVQKSDDGEYFLETEGTNLKKVLCHPLVDISRVYSNDIWETFECLGLAATRKMLLNDLLKIVDSVNESHIQLLVDRMTFTGSPTSITRYTMKKTSGGPLSKATFEQSVDIISSAAFHGETDFISGVSSAVVTGNRIRVGTGMPDILIDYEQLLKPENEIPESSNQDDDEPPQCYYY